MNNKFVKLNIKDWAKEDRPREKLVLKGVSALSDAELIAILITSGNQNETAVELAQRILYSVSNNLNNLGKLGVNDLTKFRGIGDSKAITIIAAMELGKRRKGSEMINTPQVCNSNNVYGIIFPFLADLRHEEFWILLLDRSNKVIKKKQISKGGISAAITDIRLIMKEAIDSLASGIILCHNHPSGNPEPSPEDDILTRKIQEAGVLLDIQLLDHIIIGNNNYYSYRDENRL